MIRLSGKGEQSDDLGLVGYVHTIPHVIFHNFKIINHKRQRGKNKDVVRQHVIPFSAETVSGTREQIIFLFFLIILVPLEPHKKNLFHFVLLSFNSKNI